MAGLHSSAKMRDDCHSGVIWEPGATSPAPGLFSFELFSFRADIFTLGELHHPVSRRSAASEYIPLGGAVLFWDVPDSPMAAR
jgi:hypothetical protein